VVTMLSAIQLRHNVGGTLSSSDDHNRTKITMLGLAVQRFLDTQVSDENQSSGVEVEVDELRLVQFLESFQGLAVKHGN